MVLSGTKRTSSMSSIVNQNQGGGSKKAGFPYQIGRETWTSIAFGTTNNIVQGRCAKLSCYSTLRFPLANISRPLGRDNSKGYWHIRGT